MARQHRTPQFSTDDLTSARMKKVPSSDTKPEMLVRRVLWRFGYRYCTDQRDLPGRPDVVLPKHGCIVLVHGCFWHRHRCRAGQSFPASNVEQWEAKFNRTRERDRRNVNKLRRLGWRVLVVWECQLTDIAQLATKLVRFIEGDDATMQGRRLRRLGGWSP